MVLLSRFVTQTHRNNTFSLRSKDSYICLYEHLSTPGLVVVFAHLDSNKTQIKLLYIYAISLHVWVRRMVLLSENKFGVCTSHQSTVEKDSSYFRETFFLTAQLKKCNGKLNPSTSTSVFAWLEAFQTWEMQTFMVNGPFIWSPTAHINQLIERVQMRKIPGCLCRNLSSE